MTHLPEFRSVHSIITHLIAEIKRWLDCSAVDGGALVKGERLSTGGWLMLVLNG